MPLTMRPTELSSAHWKSGNPTISRLPSRRALKDRAEFVSSVWLRPHAWQTLGEREHVDPGGLMSD